YAAGAEVLDCFCNVGGFSLNCAAAGASKVFAADISERALDEVRKNATLNGLGNKIETVQADVFELLRRYNAEGRRFGLVILDPPAFSKSKDEADSALRGYKTINKSALKLVAPGGFLVSASCTHFISVASFLQMLSDAARESGRRVRLVEMKTQSPDHASLMAEKESLYLKFFVLAVE
ncbi:MAG: class I SAM-dependent rRNA methyltransferase, partial [Clostridia bacterium]|nr:class I SAM-dependent rRNA methyltransferase [Clostridia bacterium]